MPRQRRRPTARCTGSHRTPTTFFALRPDESIDDLGPAPGYIASLAMEPDGSTVYFVPGAHGNGWSRAPRCTPSTPPPASSASWSSSTP